MRRVRVDFPKWAYEPKDFFRFEVIHQSKKSNARVGRIYTKNSYVDTPGFVPVATNATLKCIDSKVADDCGVQLMFCNTFHLMLQPGTKVVEKCGGLHKFMNRENKPLITDSGGFQVFSMQAGSMNLSNKVGLKGAGSKKQPSNVLRISDEGVLFKSYRDGKRILLTPETSVQAQKELGADIIIPFDHLPAYNVTKEELHESLRLSHLWEAESLKYHLEAINDQAMYSVIHGGSDFEMRQQSIDYLSQLPFDGIAIGGSLGKTRADLSELLKFVMPKLNPLLPVHLLGIGDMESIINAIPHGVDTFDSSYPTKLARHNSVLIREEAKPLDIRKRKFQNDLTPLSPSCECYTCRNYSRAYVHHLCRANEPVFWTLASIHNLTYMTAYMAHLRKQILDGEI